MELPKVMTLTSRLTTPDDLNGTALEIEFTARHTISGATITVADVTILGDMQSATGVVSLSGVDVSSDTDIVIEVDEAVTYDVSEADPSITVSVKDNDTSSGANPQVSIATSFVSSVAAGMPVDFTITASEQTTGKGGVY